MDTAKNEMVWYGMGTNEMVQYFNGTVNSTLLLPYTFCCEVMFRKSL